MFIALILGVLGVLLSQEQMAAALPLPVTVDCQAPPPGPLSLASHSAAPVCHRVTARGGTGLSRYLTSIQSSLAFPLMGLFCFRIQSRSPCCVELSCLPGLLWAVIDHSFLVIHDLESFEEFFRVFLNLSVLFLTLRLV